MATNLSVNVNKIALLRNSRGRTTPDLSALTQSIIDIGVQGITVHPREDGRHIKLDDVIAISQLPKISNKEVEYNIEGDIECVATS